MGKTLNNVINWFFILFLALNSSGAIFKIEKKKIYPLHNWIETGVRIQLQTQAGASKFYYNLNRTHWLHVHISYIYLYLIKR